MSLQIVQVFSDNHNGTVMSRDAYEREASTMSTGDWHTHAVVSLLKPTDKQIDEAMFYDIENSLTEEEVDA